MYARGEKKNRNRWPTYSDLGRAEQELPLAKINRPYRHTMLLLEIHRTAANKKKIVIMFANQNNSV